MSMNKGWFQLFLSLYIFCTFIVGAYGFYSADNPFFALMRTGGSMSMPLFLFALIIGLYVFFVIGQLLASLQIFMTGRWSILKYLLYASIPTCNIFGYVIYEYYFMPFFYAIIGYKTAGPEFFGNVYFGFYPLVANFNLALFDKASSGVFLVGVNIVPIIVIFLLKKYYREA